MYELLHTREKIQTPLFAALFKLTHYRGTLLVNGPIAGLRGKRTEIAGAGVSHSVKIRTSRPSARPGAARKHIVWAIPTPASAKRTLVQPNSGVPEFGRFIDWPKSETSDFGWRVREGACIKIRANHPLPTPPPTQVGPARLAHIETRPGQARGAWGREQTEFAACIARGGTDTWRNALRLLRPTGCRRIRATCV
jgi:hypothetical protein